jgi:hypothetical protein
MNVNVLSGGSMELMQGRTGKSFRNLFVGQGLLDWGLILMSLYPGGINGLGLLTPSFLQAKCLPRLIASRCIEIKGLEGFGCFFIHPG